MDPGQTVTYPGIEKGTGQVLQDLLEVEKSMVIDKLGHDPKSNWIRVQDKDKSGPRNIVWDVERVVPRRANF